MAITFTQVLDVKNNKITNLGSPTATTDAASKQYVDNIATGLIWKDAVRAAADVNVTVSSPGATIDGVSLTAGDRVLLTAQTTGSENGIYVWNGASAAMTRATDADTSGEVRPGTAVTVTEGTNNDNKTYVLNTNAPITLGTTSLNFALMNSGSTPIYTAGNGIDVTNKVITAVAASNGGIAVTSSGIGVVAAGSGGLQVGTGGIAAKLNSTASGLVADANGLAVVARPNFGLAVTSTGVGAVVNAVGGLKVDVNGLGVNFSSGGGITTDGTGTKVLVDAAGGLGLTASGLKAVAGTGILVGSTIAVDTSVVSRKFAASVGDGTATTISVTHGLNSRDVTAQVYSASAPYDTVFCEVQRTDANNVALVFGAAPTSGQYRVVVVG